MSLEIVHPAASPYSVGKEICVNSRQNLPRNNSCTIANYIWARSCGNREAKNANPAFLQSTHKAIRAWRLFLLHHRRIMPSMEIRANSGQTLARNTSCTKANHIWARSSGNGESKNANPAFVQSTHKAIQAWKLFILQHRRIMPSMEIRANSRQTLARNTSCTNANYIWAKSSGNGQAKNAHPVFVQSTLKAIRAWKLFILQHRRIVSAKETSRQNLPRNTSCTNANYIWARSCGNGEAKHANPAFVQSTHKAIRAWKLFILQHRRIVSAKEISRQNLPRNNSCTNGNYIWARSCGNGEAKKANPAFVQSTHKAIRAWKLFIQQHRRIVSAKEISRQNLPRNNSCTNGNYIWARSCGNGEAKKANPAFVQSTHKAIPACKLFLIHNRRIMPSMEIHPNSGQNLPRNNSCTNANYIWARSCGNGEAKNANPAFVQSTHKAIRAWKLFILQHRRIVSAKEISRQNLPRNNSCTNANYVWARSCGNGEAKNAHPAFVQSTHKAIRAWKLFILQHRRIVSAKEIRVNSRQNLPRNNSCTNANFIWARNCGNGEAKNAHPAFLQSTHKTIRAWKLFLLHHLRIMPSMEIRANSRQTLARNTCCTNANYIWAKSCGNGEAKNAHPAFVQSTHKAIRAWKLFILQHRRIVSAKEIRVNSRQNLPRNNSCTNANFIWARNCGNGEAKNAHPAFLQSTHKTIRAWKLFLLHHLRIMPSMEIRANSRQTLARNTCCTNANYIWARSCGNGEAKNANPAFVQSTHKAIRVWKLFILQHRRIVSAKEISRQNLPRKNSCTNANYIWARSCWNGEAKNANPAFVQSTHKAIRAWKLFLLHHRRIVSSKEIRVNSWQNLQRNNSCTNANYIWARSFGNGEAKNANPMFVQSTHKAVRAWKLFLLHHRRIVSTKEIRVNSRQNLPRNNSCTNANYIWARSCVNGEAENAKLPFLQSPHKAIQACKFFLLHHRRMMPSMEIRANSRQTLARNNSCTNANYIWARSCGNGEAENANPPFVQSTHKVVQALKLFLLHQRRIVSAPYNAVK